jgi:hypothetical protein
MGTIYYGDARHPIAIADRDLAHVQYVIVSKLRRHESFTFSWTDEVGGKRSAVWLATQIPLQFEFENADRHKLNNEWLDQLGRVAATVGGLTLLPEPGLEAVDAA